MPLSLLLNVESKLDSIDPHYRATHFSRYFRSRERETKKKEEERKKGKGKTRDGDFTLYFDWPSRNKAIQVLRENGVVSGGGSLKVKRD